MSTSPNPNRQRSPIVGSLVVLSLLAGLLFSLSGPTPSAEAATRTRSATQVSLGIDVASHQHPGGVAINWRLVRSSGVHFVLIKATEGAGRAMTASTNSWFTADWRGAQTAGLLRGAYHYARPRLPASTAVSDAKRFVAVINSAGHGRGELAPVLDLEETGGLSPKALSNWTATWLSEVTLLTGRRPIIYSGKGFWTSYLGNTSRFASYPLWIAHHTAAVQPAALPGSWKSWSFWQYSSTGRIAGIKTAVDLSFSCGLPGQTSSVCHGARTTTHR